MNLGAFIAILVFFSVLIGMFGAVYHSASKSEKRESSLQKEPEY
jgi:uncharacterized membrane protein YgdD (TMEM256/DUF423 family)